ESVKKELDVSDEQMGKLPDAVLKALSGILNEKQLKRLKQIELQQRGASAMQEANVVDALKLTEEQQGDIKTILADSKKEMAELLKGGGGGDFKGAQEKMENFRKETAEKVQGVLSADQKKAWKEMVGEPFKMERPAFGGFGGFGNKKNKKTNDNNK